MQGVDQFFVRFGTSVLNSDFVFIQVFNPPARKGILRWTGEIPPQKWMNFYTKVLSKFVSGQGLKLTLSVEVAPEGGISPQKVEETKIALQELGLADDVSSDE